MRVMKAWKAAALAGALLWGACSKEPAPTEAPKPAESTAAAEAPAPKPAAEEAENAEAPATGAPAAEDTGAPPEFKPGQSRDEVMALFGNCAERREFIPAGPNSLYVEIYQAKPSEACRKRLGERHFTIRGGQLFKITEGLLPPPPPESEYKELPSGT